MNYTFDSKTFVCNGMGGYFYQAARKWNTEVLTIVNQVREDLGLEAIFDMAMQKDKFGDLYVGHRFKDPETVAARIFTGFGTAASEHFDSEELAEMWIGAAIKNLTEQEKIDIVVEAHRDCASADHWYTFEKEWD